MRYEAIAVYIMSNGRNSTLYIGVTSNLVKRVYQHRTGAADGFTKQYNLHLLVYYKLHATMESAIHREKRLKKYKREQKIKSIETMNPNWSDLYETIV